MENNSAVQKRLAQINAELLEIGQNILDVKTDLVCLEAKRDQLIKEHNLLVKDLNRYEALLYTTNLVDLTIASIKEGLSKIQATQTDEQEV